MNWRSASLRFLLAAPSSSYFRHTFYFRIVT
jgi:hypothetical protein